MNDPLNARLRARVMSGTRPLLLPGAPNALIGHMLEVAHAEAVYLSGAGIANAFLGVPDIGLLNAAELAQHVAALREAVDIPLVVDADTGFGNALNVWRTVRTLERAGANAIQIEDQVSPKRCGHFDGKSTISAQEMRGKICAAVDARLDDNLLIIARTDARAELGLAEACDRAIAYQEAGADVIFVEAPESRDELRQIPQLVQAPHLVNMVEGGRTPILSLTELDGLGYRIVLYANSALRGAMKGAQQVIQHLLTHGDTQGVFDDMVSWDERQALVRKDVFDAAERRYSDGVGTGSAGR